MKKTQIYLWVLFLAMVTFTSCENLNEPIMLQEKFAGFQSSTGVISEDATTSIEIPVMIAATEGTGSSVTFSFSIEGIDNPAIEGVDFTLVNASKTLTWSAAAGLENIEIMAIDNSVYDKDKKINIILSDPTNGYVLGADVSYTLTISDNEHPLALLLGSYSVAANSYFNGAEVYAVTTEPDPADDTHLIINGFVNGGSDLPIYGIVDLNAMTISIPVKQDMTSVTYVSVLEGFFGPDGATGIPDGGFITGNIDKDGNITIADEYGSSITEGAYTGYWLNIYQSGAVFTKSKKKITKGSQELATPSVK